MTNNQIDKLQIEVDLLKKKIAELEKNFLAEIDKLKAIVNKEKICPPKTKKIEKTALKNTFDRISNLYDQKKKPISLSELADHLGMSKDTVYRHCEQLIEIERVRKYYGRGLMEKPSKSAFYSPSVSLYDFSIIQEINDPDVRNLGTVLIQITPEESFEIKIDELHKHLIDNNIQISKRSLSNSLDQLRSMGLIVIQKNLDSEKIIRIVR